MEYNTESVFLKNDCTVFHDTARGECKTEIDSTEVSKILGIYVKAVGSEGELKDNTVKYKSNVIYSVCYVDNEKNIKKSEISGEIKGDMVGVTANNGYVRVNVKVGKTEADISGIKLAIRVVFEVEALVFEQRKTDFVLGGDGLILKKQDCEYYRSYGKRQTVFPIEEEFSLNYAILNVLSHKITPTVTAVQCGVGCIIVDGEVHISALLLQCGEKRDIIKEDKVVPFRAEVEYDEAMPVMLANAEVFEKSFKTDISVDEQANTSVVKVSINLLFEGEAYSLNNIVVCDDAFCLNKEIDCKITVEDKVKPLEQRFFTKEFKGKTNSVSGVENTTFVTQFFESVEITDQNYKKGFIEVEGVIGYTAFFRTADGDIISRKLDSEFSTSLEVGENQDAIFEVSAKIISINSFANSGGEVTSDFTLAFNVFGKQTEKLQLLTGVEEKGEKQLNNSSISVYIPIENEDLWSLSKRLNVEPNEICEVNKDLQFPLSGKERIVVYRQKIK